MQFSDLQMSEFEDLYAASPTIRQPAAQNSQVGVNLTVDLRDLIQYLMHN